VTATLYTACGCQKKIDIPYPPNRTIVIPLREPSAVVFTDKENPPPNHIRMRLRQFDLLGYRGGPHGTAEYLERLEPQR